MATSSNCGQKKSFHRATRGGFSRQGFSAPSAGLVLLAFASGCSSDEPGVESTALLSEPDICDTALFCDDFESGTVNMPPRESWSVKAISGSVIFDDSRAFAGAQAVKATTLAAADYKTALLGFRDDSVLPTADNAHFGRMMFFLQSAPTEQVHWTFLDGLGQAPATDEFPNGYEVVYRYGGQKPVAGGSQLMASYETPGWYSSPQSGPDTDCHQDSDQVPMVEGRWSCAEWRFDGASAEMQLWIDGEEVSGLHVIGNGTRCRTLADDYPWTPPVFSQIDVGWESYQTDEERSIWVDDFIIDSTRIGCPAQLP